ncbi:MAG: hypothetical protein WAU86_06350, partial [Oricola sp.]
LFLSALLRSKIVDGVEVDDLVINILLFSSALCFMIFVFMPITWTIFLKSTSAARRYHMEFGRLARLLYIGDIDDLDR